MEPLASYGKSRFSSNTNLSRSISLSILDHYENDIEIETNISNPFEFIIPRDPNLLIPSMIYQNVTSILHNQSFNFHYLNIKSILPISIHFEIDPQDKNLSYLLIYKFDQIPKEEFDGWTFLCPFNLTNDNIYRYFIDNQHTIDHQSIVFGLRELNSTEMNNFCSNISIKTSLPIITDRFEFTSNYKLRLYTSGCYYLDDENQWKSDGLLVGPLTNLHQTHCFSTHLTTFAGSLQILPPSINLNFVLSNMDFIQNKTIYLTVISVTLIYIILIIYARHKDRKDIEKLGVTPLSDNREYDKYYYEIIVFTGQRKDSGTESKVHFVIGGDQDETQIRIFSDSNRKIFQRGEINAFVMSVPKSLGLLNYLHIWHDNSGQGSSASWFLKYIIIQDLQTMEKFHFIAQKWFGVEKDDGKIERLLPVANQLEKEKFSYLLSKRTYHNLSDNHLWFSIFSRPPSNKFTRVQRCTCSFVLLFISMFLNILYYDLTKDNNSTNGVSLAFGPLFITLQQIITGIIIEFLSLLVSLLLVQFFRRIRSRQNQISPLNQALIKIQSESKIKKEKSKSGLTFPWWCIFIAYGISFLLIGLSILFIIARGIEFGDLKSQKWLTSILTGFFSSIFLTQPLKVLFLAIFFSFFFSKSNNDDDKEAKEYLDNIQLNYDEEYRNSNKTNSFPSAQQNRLRANRLTKEEIDFARFQRLKDIHMWSIIYETLTYICFLLLLFVIVYSNRNYNSYLQVKHLKNYFQNSNYLKVCLFFIFIKKKLFI